MSARMSINSMNSARTIYDVNSWCLHAQNPESRIPRHRDNFHIYEFYMGPQCDDDDYYDDYDDAKDDDGIFTWEFYEQQIALQITR